MNLALKCFAMAPTIGQFIGSDGRCTSLNKPSYFTSQQDLDRAFHLHLRTWPGHKPKMHQIFDEEGTIVSEPE